MKKNNFKNVLLILSTVIFLLAAVGIAHAAALIPDSAEIKVSLISQEPDPGTPGEVIDVRFKIENTGSTPTGNLIFEVIEKYPFTVYDKQITKNIGSLQGWQKDSEGVIVLYKIKIDENAVQGTETLDIRYKKEDISQNWIYIKDFPINIRTRDLVISVESITSNPDPIPPGKDAKIDVKIKNYADSLIRDLKIKLDISDDDTPFAPVNSITEKKVYQLKSNEETSIRFNLVALPEADGGVYKIPFEMSYTDETGTQYTKDDIISLKIGSKPDLLITVDSSEIYQKKKSGEIVIKIINRGLGDLKLLNVKIIKTDDFNVLSQEEVYVGNIDSDDYETVEFTLDIKSKQEYITLPIEINYMDSNNNEYTQKKDISLRVLGSKDAKKAGLAKESSIGTIITVLIVITGLAVYFWRRRKKKKKKQKQ